MDTNKEILFKNRLQRLIALFKGLFYTSSLFHLLPSIAKRYCAFYCVSKTNQQSERKWCVFLFVLFSHSSRGCSSLFLPPRFPPSAINARKCGQPLHRSQLLVGRCRQDMPCYDRNTHKRHSCQKVQTILAGFGVFFCVLFAPLFDRRTVFTVATFFTQLPVEWQLSMVFDAGFLLPAYIPFARI